MKLAALSLTVIASLAAGSANSDTDTPAMTAGDLAEICQGSDTTSQNVCRVYILGVVQGITVGMDFASGRLRGGQPCIPQHLSAEDLEAALKARLREHLAASPADRTAAAAGFIGAMTLKAFPCAK